MKNHESWIICLFCGATFDGHLHGLSCPHCHHDLHEGEYEFE